MTRQGRVPSQLVRFLVLCLALHLLSLTAECAPRLRAKKDGSSAQDEAEHVNLIDIELKRAEVDGQGSETSDVESIRPTPNFSASYWVDPEEPTGDHEETTISTQRPPLPSPTRQRFNVTRRPPRPSPTRQRFNVTRRPPRPSPTRQRFNVTRRPPRLSPSRKSIKITRRPMRSSFSRRSSKPTRFSNMPSLPSRNPLNPTRFPNMPSLPSKNPFNVTRFPNMPSLPSKNPLNPTRFPNMPSLPSKNPFNVTRFPNMPSLPSKNPLNPTRFPNMPSLRSRNPFDMTRLPPRRSPSRRPRKPTKTRQPERSPSQTREPPQMIQMTLKGEVATFNRDEFIRHVSQASKVAHSQIVIVSITNVSDRLMKTSNNTSPNARVLVIFEVHGDKSQSSQAAAESVMSAVEKGHPDLVNINLIHAQMNDSDPVVYVPDFEYDDNEDDDEDEDEGDDDDDDDEDKAEGFKKVIIVVAALGAVFILIPLAYFSFRPRPSSTKESLLDVEATREMEAQQAERDAPENAVLEMHEL